MGNNKSRADGITLRIEFESESRAFNSENPIIGVVHIESNYVVAAYCLQATLQQRDNSKKIDHGDKG